MTDISTITTSNDNATNNINTSPVCVKQNQTKGAIAVFETLAQSNDDIKYGRVMSLDDAHKKIMARFD